MGDGHGAQGEAELGEVAAEDLRGVVRGTEEEVLLRVEAEDAAGSGAAGATGALGS